MLRYERRGKVEKIIGEGWSMENVGTCCTLKQTGKVPSLRLIRTWVKEVRLFSEGYYTAIVEMDKEGNLFEEALYE